MGVSRAQVRQQWRARFRGESGVPRNAKLAANRNYRGTTPGEADAGVPPLSLSIHVRHLDCHGIGQLNEEQIIGAMRTELQTLIAAQGAPSGWAHDRSIRNLRAGAEPGSARVTADFLGARVARAIYGLRGTEVR